MYLHVNVNIKNKKNTINYWMCVFRSQTALHKAAWNRHQEVCSMLVAAGSSLTKTDHQVGYVRQTA